MKLTPSNYTILATAAPEDAALVSESIPQLNTRLGQRGFAGYIAAAIDKLNETFELFWSGTDAQIELRLNHLGATQVQQLFATNAAQAPHLNSVAETLGIPNRANIIPPREVTVSLDGLFTLVPLPTTEQPTEQPTEN